MDKNFFNNFNSKVFFIQNTFDINVTKEQTFLKIDVYSFFKKQGCLEILEKLDFNIKKDVYYTLYGLMSLECELQNLIIPPIKMTYKEFLEYKLNYLSEIKVTLLELNKIHCTMNKLLEYLKIGTILDIYGYFKNNLETLCKFNIYLDDRLYSEISYKEMFRKVIDYWPYGNDIESKKNANRLKKINVNTNEYNTLLDTFSKIDNIINTN